MLQFAGRNLQTASVTVKREEPKFSIFDKIENRDMLIFNIP